MTTKKSLKKIAQILILAALISAIFVACDEADTETEISTTDVAAETAVLEETEDTTRLLPDLPEYDWDGYNFRIITAGGDTDSTWSIRIPRDIAVEEENGSPLNDAIYYRNRNLEEKYNFTIEHILMAPNADYPLRSAVMAGDEYFDAISLFIGGGAAAASAQERLLVDLYKLEHLDLEKPWWDQSFVKNITLGGKLFFISGDLTLINRDSTLAMLFNKELIEDLQLENPYELVRNDQWTFAKLKELSIAAAVDLNGDGDMKNDTDQFGFVFALGGAISSGVKYTEMGADGIPVLTFGSERNFDMIYSCWDFMISDYAGGLLAGYTGDDTVISGPEGIFKSGRGLFFSAMIRTVENLREAEIDFGIIPVPKYDESQNEWVHGVNPIYAQVLAVPNFGNNEALKRTGFILEAIASESTYTTVPAWYDVQLTTKFARDTESKEMLDIIFSSMSWSTFSFYYWGENFNAYVSARNGRLASDWTSNVNKIEKEIQNTIKAFEKLD